MALTPAQLATLRTAIDADPAARAARVAGDTFTLMAWCNGAASPSQPAWRVAAVAQDADQAPSYATFDSIVAGKRESWGFFLAFPRDFTKAKVRRWVTDVWGSATAGSNAESILLAGTESVTNAQLAFGGTMRTEGTVAALDRAFIGIIDGDDAAKLVAAA